SAKPSRCWRASPPAAPRSRSFQRAAATTWCGSPRITYQQGPWRRWRSLRWRSFTCSTVPVRRLVRRGTCREDTRACDRRYYAHGDASLSEPSPLSPRPLPVPNLAEVAANPAVLDGLPIDALVDLRRLAGYLVADVDAAFWRRTALAGQQGSADQERD